jgi:hypothetical protein
MKSFLDELVGAEGLWNRICFCLFWVGMYIAVIYSRYLSVQTGLIENSAQIREFDIGQVSQMLTTLLLISAFLERALEVYALTFREKGEKRIDDNVKKLKASQHLVDEVKDDPDFKVQMTTLVETFSLQEIWKEAEKAVENAGKKIIVMNKLRGLIDSNEERATVYKDTTRRYILWSALCLGILISIVGVRGLAPFIDLGNGDSWQDNWFKLFDICLTGAIIAGGSDIIHKILQVVTTFMDAIATSNKAVKDANTSGTN